MMEKLWKQFAEELAKKIGIIPKEIIPTCRDAKIIFNVDSIDDINFDFLFNLDWHLHMWKLEIYEENSPVNERSRILLIKEFGKPDCEIYYDGIKVMDLDTLKNLMMIDEYKLKNIECRLWLV